METSRGPGPRLLLWTERRRRGARRLSSLLVGVSSNPFAGLYYKCRHWRWSWWTEFRPVLSPYAGTSRELVSPNKCVWDTPEYLFLQLYKGESASCRIILKWMYPRKQIASFHLFAFVLLCTDRNIGIVPNGQCSGGAARRPGCGVREGVYTPLQRCAAEPEWTSTSQHSDRHHPNCRQCAVARTLRCACGLQVGSKA